jgi:hypothetical protein
MNILLKSSFLMLFSIFLSVSPMEHNKSQIITQDHASNMNNSLNFLGKCCYVGGYALGITSIAGYAALKIMNIAEEHHHQDPVSEATAAFLLTGAIGAFIGKASYDFYSYLSSHSQPANIISGPSNKYLKNKNATHEQKNLRKEIKTANKKRDNKRK